MPQSVAIGIDHSCAVTRSGELRCWGANTFGALGLNDTEMRFEIAAGVASVPLPKPHRYVAVAAGHESSCAITDEGAVHCWGLNETGQLGLGDVAPRLGDDGKKSITVDLGAP
jgi:alpha-tubulin suppressor-like RCC1 family protein